MIRLFLTVIFIIFTVVPAIDADDNANHRDALSKHYRLEKPDGEGPFPAVILVSGCSGFSPKFAPNHYNDVQNKLVELGFTTLRVDYLAARNIESCMQLTASAAGGDIGIAADYLNKQKNENN